MDPIRWLRERIAAFLFASAEASMKNAAFWVEDNDDVAIRGVHHLQHGRWERHLFDPLIKHDGEKFIEIHAAVAHGWAEKDAGGYVRITAEGRGLLEAFRASGRELPAQLGSGTDT